MIAIVHDNLYHHTPLLDSPNWELESFGVLEKFNMNSNCPVQFPKKCDIVSGITVRGENISQIELRDFSTDRLLYSKQVHNENEVTLPIWFSNNTPSLTSTTITVYARSEKVLVEYTGIFNKDRTIL